MPRVPGFLMIIAAASLLSACSTFDGGAAPKLEKQARWVVLPFTNTTETPLAGQRAEMLASSLLIAENIGEISSYPLDTRETLFTASNEVKIREEALAWARKQGVRYAMTGEVFEWRYKVGVDGEPAVGISLRVIDVPTGKTLWAGAASKSGWHRDSLGMIAQGVLGRLIDRATDEVTR